MSFKIWLESSYYHSTSPENAENILKNGIDVSQYKSGMFVGFYLSKVPLNKQQATLKFEIDENQLMDIQDVTDQDLKSIDPNYQMMSYGYKNHLITKYVLNKGKSGVINGKEIILFNDKPVKNINYFK